MDAGNHSLQPAHFGRIGAKYIKIPSEKSSTTEGVREWGVHGAIYADTPKFPIDFCTHIYYNICMQNKNSKKARSRAEILAEIASLPPSVQGTISSYANVRKNGTKVVYHNLQYTHGGRHRSFAIPVGKVDEFKAAVAAGKKLKELVLELSRANAEEIASSESPLKKSSRTSSSRAPRRSTR